LEAYSDILGDKRRIVALNKCDALDGKTISTRRKALEKASGGPVHVISGAAGMGLQDVLRAIYREIQGATPVVETGPWQP
jgi:GTP-binding protein